MARDSAGVVFERLEGGDQGLVAFVDGAVKAVVPGGFLGDLPDAFDAVQLRRVGRQTEQLDAVTMGGEPLLSNFFEPMAGSVVYDEEDLAAWTATDQLLDEG